jgi:hypothetical protein
MLKRGVWDFVGRVFYCPMRWQLGKYSAEKYFWGQGNSR